MNDDKMIIDIDPDLEARYGLSDEEIEVKANRGFYFMGRHVACDRKTGKTMVWQAGKENDGCVFDNLIEAIHFCGENRI